MGEKWKGGDMDYPGGGFKVNLLREELAKIADGKDESVRDPDRLVVMFTDAYDVVFTGGPEKILRTFRESFPGSKVVFGAEGFCWPRKDLEKDYPEARTEELEF